MVRSRSLGAGALWIGIAVLARPGFAQDSSRVAPIAPPVGAHVRGLLRADSARFDGYVIAIEKDSMRLARCKECDISTSIALENADALEIEHARSHITGRHILRNAALGLVAGTVVGVGAGYLAAENAIHHCAPNDDLCGLSWLAVPIGGALGAGVGFVSGIVVALLEKQPQWEPFRAATGPDRGAP